MMNYRDALMYDPSDAELASVNFYLPHRMMASLVRLPAAMSKHPELKTAPCIRKGTGEVIEERYWVGMRSAQSLSDKVRAQGAAKRRIKAREAAK